MKSYSITNDCIGCTLCAKNCPVGAISGEAKGQHAIDPDKCIRCGLCGRLCAKAAIRDENGAVCERVPKKDWKKPVIDTLNCAGCSLCVENCPKNALKLSAPRYHGDTRIVAELAERDACIGCGLCAKACPIGAIQMCAPGETPTYNNIKEKHRMNKAYCRVFQGAMKLGNYFLGYRMPEYVEGPGSVRKLPEMVRKAGGSNVLLVNDPFLHKIGLNKSLLESLDAAGMKYTLFTDITPNPTVDNVEAGLKAYQEGGCDSIVALGGGSSMDCAKGIAARLMRPNKTVQQLQGLLTVRKQFPRFFAIPTTAGTGSETTVAAVITDPVTHRKASINDPAILPKYAVLDPELTMSLPPYVTATTGMDALCHAVEAYTNHTYNTALEDDLSRKAVKLIYDNLLLAFNEGSNLEARQNMQKGAFFAGRAFTRGCVGYVHAVGHTLSGLYGKAHGEVMAIILPHVMRQFGEAVYPRLAELAEVCGIEGTNQKEKALHFIEWIEELNRTMGIPAGVDCIQDKDIPQMIKWAMKEANPLYPVPVIWGEEDFRRLINTIRL